MVVVAADSKTVAMVCDLFALLGLPAISCPPSADAPTCIRAYQPSLIILDVTFGPFTGIDLLHQIRATPTLIAVPIIFFSGDENHLRQLLPDYPAHGATFVPKPQLEELQRVVRALLPLAARARGSTGC